MTLAGNVTCRKRWCHLYVTANRRQTESRTPEGRRCCPTTQRWWRGITQHSASSGWIVCNTTWKCWHVQKCYSLFYLTYTDYLLFKYFRVIYTRNVVASGSILILLLRYYMVKNRTCGLLYMKRWRWLYQCLLEMAIRGFITIITAM